MNELFIISPRSIKAYDAESVHATAAGLKELGLYHLPYSKVDIQMPIRPTNTVKLPKGTPTEVFEDIIHGKYLVAEPSPEESYIAVRYVGAREDGTCEQILYEAYPPKFDSKLLSELPRAGANLCHSSVEYLIVLLATRNAVKEVQENKLLKLGIGKTKKKQGSQASYSRVTTITVPDDHELEPDPDRPPTGRTVCAHLRRGHIRRQRYGPELAYIKVRWIEPVFVNADEDFVSQRKAYNLKL
jgi:hypothetical protein